MCKQKEEWYSLSVTTQKGQLQEIHCHILLIFPASIVSLRENVISLIKTPRGPSFSEVRKNKKKLSKKKTKKHTHVTVRFLKPTVMATRDDNRSSKNEKTRSKKQTMDQFVRTGM